jgi:hypothetical protein
MVVGDRLAVVGDDRFFHSFSIGGDGREVCGGLSEVHEIHVTFLRVAKMAGRGPTFTPTRQRRTFEQGKTVNQRPHMALMVDYVPDVEDLPWSIVFNDDGLHTHGYQAGHGNVQQIAAAACAIVSGKGASAAR